MSVEMDLYIALKGYLKDTGWEIVGGQPPSGSDHLPVVEIKLNHGLEKGSKESFKPDLLALRENQLMLFEIKPKYSQSDFEKLLTVLDSDQRINALWLELGERKVRDSLGNIVSLHRDQIVVDCALAYQGSLNHVPRVWTFLRVNGTFEEFPPCE
jgi:hypothetical protein